jgi:hypothetical protein
MAKSHSQKGAIAIRILSYLALLAILIAIALLTYLRPEYMNYIAAAIMFIVIFTFAFNGFDGSGLIKLTVIFFAVIALAFFAVMLYDFNASFPGQDIFHQSVVQGKSISINLSEIFAGEEPLKFGVVGNKNIVVDINRSIARLKAVQNFTGTENITFLLRNTKNFTLTAPQITVDVLKDVASQVYLYSLLIIFDLIIILMLLLKKSQ